MIDIGIDFLLRRKEALSCQNYRIILVENEEKKL
jgi:hypothetical protein